MKVRILTTAVVAAATLAGCGISDPYNDDSGQSKRVDRSAPELPKADPDGYLPGTIPEELREPEPKSFPGAGTTPERTLERAAELYGNWTSETAPEVFDEIVALSVGDARAQLRSIASQARTDIQQTAAGTTSTATVEAVEVRGEGDRRKGLAVTRARVRGENLSEQGAQYYVTTAVLERRGDRWVIAEWTPQP
jgi:hypothetical protein